MSKPKDIAHENAEKEIDALTKRFQSIYSQANREVQEKLNNYLERFKKQDEAMLKKMENGNITQDEYQKWYQNRVFAGKQWRARLDALAEDYTHANQLAMNAVNGALLEVYADNFNYAAYLTEQQVRADLSFQLVDRWTVERLARDNPQLLPAPSVNIPKDKRWNRQKIMSAVTQGIIQGESMQKIARRLKKVTDMNAASAIRNARTAVTGAECAGRVDSYKVAEIKGVQMVQVWRATLDSRTRHSHAAIDGEEIEPGGTFSNGCQYPGDPHGEPSEVYNCRCTILGHVKGYEKYHQRGAYGNGKLGDESYDEWKARHSAEFEKSSKSNQIPLTNNNENGIINEERYRTFQEGQEVNDFFYYDNENRGLRAMKNSEHGKWIASLSQRQRIDIADYCGDGYADINSYWRKYGDWQEINAEKVRAQTKSLDEAIASYNLKSDIKTYRAVQPEAFQEYWGNIQGLVGKEYTDPAFMSTSPFKGSDAVNKDCIMELLIPAGQGRGAYINNLSGFQDKEYEFLLARDSKFKIYSVEETEEKLILKMEMIV